MARKTSEPAVASKPTRPRKSPAATCRTGRAATQTVPTSKANASVIPCMEGQIRERAYYICLEREGTGGDAVADWYQSERELNGIAAGAGE